MWTELGAADQAVPVKIGHGHNVALHCQKLAYLKIRPKHVLRALHLVDNRATLGLDGPNPVRHSGAEPVRGLVTLGWVAHTLCIVHQLS